MSGSLAVNVALFDDERLLLVQREDFEVWCLPGGEVDPGESLAEAAVREVREETGIAVALGHLVGTYSRPNWHSGIHVVLFAGTAAGGALRPDPSEAVAADWFAPEQLPAPLLVGQRERIEDALSGRRGIARSSLVRSPFASRAEAYRFRDESTLARSAFYEARMSGLDLDGASDPGVGA